jgi:hypothetical protein
MNNGIVVRATPSAIQQARISHLWSHRFGGNAHDRRKAARAWARDPRVLQELAKAVEWLEARSATVYVCDGRPHNGVLEAKKESLALFGYHLTRSEVHSFLSKLGVVRLPVSVEPPVGFRARW